MGKRDESVVKVVKKRAYTRMQAERGMTAGTLEPSRFIDMNDPFQRPDSKDPGASKNHGNYHVRNKAWKMMGKPIPEGWSKDDKKKFFESIHYNPPSTNEEASVDAEAAVNADVTA